MKELIESKWEEILSLLETEYDISSIMINTWIRSLKIYEVKNNTVYFYVDEKLGENALKFLKRKEFDIFLLSSIRETLNDSTIDIVIDEKKNLIESDEEARKESVQKSDSYKEAVSRSNLNPKYTFDTFIVGEGNRHAHATCLAVADLPGQDNFNPLFLYGNSGLGKTHLMQSIAHYILQKDDKTKVLYVPSETFTHEIIDAIKNHTTNEFREKYRNIDVLLVDDIQFIIGKESTQEEFFHTFNSLHSAKKQIIISSDKPPKDMEILEERFRSRFEWGLIADITLPDYETRMAILHKKEEMDGYDINEEVIKYIANNIKSNIRELEGAINKVMAFAKLEKKEVTLELAEQALKDIISPDEKKVITPDYIISMVAEHFDVTVDDLCGNKRNSKIVTPRQIAMYLCREIISTPLKSIGKSLGNRDHTTIMHGIDKIEKEISNDENLKNTIETLKKKINPQG